MIDNDRREDILSFYESYTNAFQTAYERFAADPNGVPDASDALPYYHAPCLFITPLGVVHYATEADLARHFEGVMCDMKTRRYQRTGLGPIHLTAHSSRCMLLSLTISRFDLDDQQYDEYGVTYTIVRMQSEWRIAVVNTHPKDGVLAGSSRAGSGTLDPT